MPTRSLTAEQRQAIDAREVSVALSAGAGCGKTFVLVERFLSHLGQPAGANGDAEPAELRQLIAITFTDAAAREMRARIRSRSYEQLHAAERDDEQRHWQRLVREIDAARIGTIHSFCASLLRSAAAEAGLDPTFAVLDQGDADVLQYDVIDDVLRRHLGDQDGDTLDLASAFGLVRLKQQVAVLLGQRHRTPFHTWQAAVPQQLVARWHEWHLREAVPNAAREIAAAAPVEELLSLLRLVSPGKDAFCDARGGLLDLLPQLSAAEVSEQQLARIRALARVQGVCTAKDWTAAEAFNQYRDACKKLRDLIDQHQPNPFDPQAALEAAELGLALLRLVAKVSSTYADRKDNLGLLDFDDLLSRAHALLTDPQHAALRDRLAKDLRLLLVDEFQDTDQLQVDLVKALCGPGIDHGRLFFVGDFKQSIYRFRGAEPKVFSALRGELAERGRLPLNVSFRSQPALLDFINALFCRAFDRDGRSYEALRASRRQAAAGPAVEFLWTLTANKNSHAKGAAEEARRQEARAIARRLRALLDSSSDEQPIVDRQSGAPRAVQLGDVAILFRALSDVHLYEEALREYELPYYLVGGHAFYAQQEVYDVLNLLRAVASTADELSLAGVLRSPFFSLCDETLLWLSQSRGSLNAGLMAEPLPRQLTADERAKAAAAAETMRTLRAMKDRVPVATLLGAALERTGYDAVLLAEFLGERKLANLHKLLERARAADQGIMDLDGFITQLAQFTSQQPKEALAATLSENADVIRLMTIHHAKGLEFPLVIVPDLDRPPHIVPPCAALHGDLGPLVPMPVDDERKVATGMTLFAAVERVEELEERKRLLYVAATRAADYLILSSSLESYDKPKSDWMKLIAERFNLETGDLCGQLPAGYERPRVRVVTNPGTVHQPVGKSRGPDLLEMLDEAHRLAADDDGMLPSGVAPVLLDRAGQKALSVSQLMADHLVDELPRSARSDGGERPRAPSDARGLGTLVHDVLSRVDLWRIEEIGEWCQRLALENGLRNVSQAAREGREMIERFATSPRGQRLAQARAVHREVEFLLAWPPGRSDGDARHIRGYVDCLYQDDDGWHLIDYKTHYIASADIERALQDYKMQIGLYALAVERAFGQPPVELVLSILRPGAERALSWDADARLDTIDLVNQAIAERIDRKFLGRDAEG